MIKKTLLTTLLFICFLTFHCLRADPDHLRLVVTVPEIAITTVTKEKIENHKVKKINKSRKKAPIDLGRTEVLLAANSDNFEAHLTLDASLPSSTYVDTKGRYKLISESNPERYLILKALCLSDDGHLEELFYNSILARSRSDSIRVPQKLTVGFQIPDDQLDFARGKMVYRTILTIEIKTIK